MQPLVVTTDLTQPAQINYCVTMSTVLEESLFRYDRRKSRKCTTTAGCGLGKSKPLLVSSLFHLPFAIDSSTIIGQCRENEKDTWSSQLQKMHSHKPPALSFSISLLQTLRRHTLPPIASSTGASVAVHDVVSAISPQICRWTLSSKQEA